MNVEDDHKLPRLEVARRLAEARLSEQTGVIGRHAVAAALSFYDDALDHRDAARERAQVVALARSVAAATLRAVPAQYRGANGDYCTLERLTKFAERLEGPVGTGEDAHERRG